MLLIWHQDVLPDGQLTLQQHQVTQGNDKIMNNKKLSYCWETVRHESMPRIAEMDVEMTT